MAVRQSGRRTDRDLALLDDARGEARVDIVADGVAVSSVDDCRFESREDVPTIGGDRAALVPLACDGSERSG